MSSLLVFKRVYRLEIQSVMLVFSTSFVNYYPYNLLNFSLISSPPLPCVNKYSIMYVNKYTMRKGGGVTMRS
jgi:hypothetical protein